MQRGDTLVRDRLTASPTILSRSQSGDPRDPARCPRTFGGLSWPEMVC
jgi:hypothetical protein